ncbi:hypothetical protein D3C77_301100 [compost metagenome]
MPADVVNATYINLPWKLCDFNKSEMFLDSVRPMYKPHGKALFVTLRMLGELKVFVLCADCCIQLPIAKNSRC